MRFATDTFQAIVGPGAGNSRPHWPPRIPYVQARRNLLSGDRELMLVPMRPTEKVLQKILGRRFSFTGSQADLELLRSIYDRTYANTKTGDPSFHAYAAAVNAATEFGSQALDIPELIPFNNQLADLQEEYIPSYPPMSPVTISLLRVLDGFGRAGSHDRVNAWRNASPLSAPGWQIRLFREGHGPRPLAR